MNTILQEEHKLSCKKRKKNKTKRFRSRCLIFSWTWLEIKSLRRVFKPALLRAVFGLLKLVFVTQHKRKKKKNTRLLCVFFFCVSQVPQWKFSSSFLHPLNCTQPSTVSTPHKHATGYKNLTSITRQLVQLILQFLHKRRNQTYWSMGG